MNAWIDPGLAFPIHTPLHVRKRAMDLWRTCFMQTTGHREQVMARENIFFLLRSISLICGIRWGTVEQKRTASHKKKEAKVQTALF
jgi:hypothetical protein